MHQPAQLERDVPAVLEQVASSVRSERADSALGVSNASTTMGTVGTVRSPHASTSATPRAARSRGSRSRPRQALANDDSSSIRRRPCVAASVASPAWPAEATLAVGAGVERVEPNGTAGPQRHRANAPRVGQVAVLALGVDDPGAAPEDGLAPQEGLDEGALAAADLAEHDQVRVRHHARGVELERVEDERAAEKIVADDHAALAESGFGDERVRRAEIPRGAPGAPAGAVALPSHHGERSPTRLRSLTRRHVSVTLTVTGTAVRSGEGGALMSETERPLQPLVVTLAALTVTGGMLDAVSFLGLGHVFTNNMTGNVILIGFAAAGAPRLLLAASLTTLGQLPGRCRGRWPHGPAGRVAPDAAADGHGPQDRARRQCRRRGRRRFRSGRRWATLTVIALLGAFSLGVRYTAVRRMGVPDMTTSVLTTTLTGLASDSSFAGGTNDNVFQRSTSVVCMFVGALVGAVLVLHVGAVWSLGAAAAIVAARRGRLLRPPGAPAAARLGTLTQTTQAIPSRSNCSWGAPTSFSATRNNSTISVSAALPVRFSSSAGSRSRSNRKWRVHRSVPDPERQAVAGFEGLADHRDVRAGHEVEPGPPVGRRQANDILQAVHGHGGPAVGPHGQREVRSHRPPGVLAPAVRQLHPVPVDATDGPLPDRAPPSQCRRAAARVPCAFVQRDATAAPCPPSVPPRTRRPGSHRCRHWWSAPRTRFPPIRRPASAPGTACVRAARTASRPACPRCPSRRGSAHGRCTRTRPSNPTASARRARRRPGPPSGRSWRAWRRSWPGCAAPRVRSAGPRPPRPRRRAAR